MPPTKQDNVRFRFLIRLRCDHDQAKVVASELDGTVMAFAQDATTCWISMTLDPSGKPTSRKHFKVEYKGGKLLAKAQAELMEEITPALIDHTLKELATNREVTGLNEKATAWLSQNRANATIVAAATNRDDPKDSLLAKLEQEFYSSLCANDHAPTAEQFLNSFHNTGRLCEVVAVSKNIEVFRKLRSNYATITRPARKEKAMRESLQEFCETHPLPEAVPSARALVAQVGYRGLVEAMTQTFVVRQEVKKRAIWFHGAPNCGKTIMTRLLSQIFVTQDLLLAEGKYTLVSGEHSVATQLVLLDEANFNDLFKPSNLPNVKLFFEGRGYPQRVMMQTPVMTYQGACVFLTSNGLPALSKSEPGRENYDWTAIRTRTTFFKMDVTHPGKAKFPFDATILAHAILETAALYEPSLTQCSQPQSQPPFEEEKHLPPVPDFHPAELTDLLSDTELSQNPKSPEPKKPVQGLIGKRTTGYTPVAKLHKQVRGQMTIGVGIESIIIQRPKRQTNQLTCPSSLKEF